MVILQNGDLSQVKRKRYLVLVWALLFSTILNATYAVVRWWVTAGYVSIDEVLLSIYRNVVVIFMAISILGGILLSRREAPKQKREQHPLIWSIFEVCVITMTAIDAVLNILTWNALAPVIDLSIVSSFIQSTGWASILIGGIIHLNILLLVAYIALKIPIATGTATTFFGRVYIRGHRVHESVVGLIWVIIAAGLIMYGGSIEIDHWLGIFYLMFGMFLIGRDYMDVKRLDFLRDLREKKDNDQIIEKGHVKPEH